MQSKQELEDFYKNQDPWGYKTNPEDANRLKQILFLLGWGQRSYKRALDIGCGEGFITTKLPAEEIHGMDISDNALTRLPQNVKAVSQPEGKYDLVITTGTLYQQYDHEKIHKLIVQSASKYVLIGGIADWLVNYSYGKQVHFHCFNYREFTQKLTLYDISVGS